MNPEVALLKFVEGIGNTDFSFIIFFIQIAFVIFWIVVIGWVWVDVSERTTNTLIKFFSVVLVTIFNVLGLVIYLVLRPKQTIQELYWADLERRYLKYETSELGDCPNCHFSLAPGFNVCPQCGTQLKKQCHNCHVWVEKTYKYCPFCSTNIDTPNIVTRTIEESEETKMETEVNKSKEEAIKMVEGNHTKYVDRGSVIHKVKGGVSTFVKNVGDFVLRKKVKKNSDKVVEEKVKKLNNKKKDRKNKRRK